MSGRQPRQIPYLPPTFHRHHTGTIPSAGFLSCRRRRDSSAPRSTEPTTPGRRTRSTATSPPPLPRPGSGSHRRSTCRTRITRTALRRMRRSGGAPGAAGAQHERLAVVEPALCRARPVGVELLQEPDAALPHVVEVPRPRAPSRRGRAAASAARRTHWRGGRHRGCSARRRPPAGFGLPRSAGPVGSLIGDAALVSGGRLADHAHDGRFVLVDRSPDARCAAAVQELRTEVARRGRRQRGARPPRPSRPRHRVGRTGDPGRRRRP